MLTAELKTLRKTWSGQVDKNFRGRTKNFNTITEKFYPRIGSANPKIDFNEIFPRLLQGVGGV